jgi:hypothetical protein
MKKNVTILIGLVVLFAVLYAGNTFMRKGGSELNVTEGEKSSVAMKSVSGQVLRGDNVFDYAFDIPETATTSLSMDGALIKVTDVLVTDAEASTSEPIVVSTPVATCRINNRHVRSNHITNIIHSRISANALITYIQSSNWC